MNGFPPVSDQASGSTSRRWFLAGGAGAAMSLVTAWLALRADRPDVDTGAVRVVPGRVEQSETQSPRRERSEDNAVFATSTFSKLTVNERSAVFDARARDEPWASQTEVELRRQMNGIRSD